MKALKKFLSVLLTAAMLFSLVPAVFAGGAEGDAPVLMSMPTPERIFAVVNDYSVDEYGFVGTEYGWVQDIDPETGEPSNVYDYFNEDGTLTEEFRNLLVEYYMASIEDGSLDFDYVDGMEIPSDIYEFVYFEVMMFYNLEVELFNSLIDAANESGDTESAAMMQGILDSFTADYPDAKALYDQMMTDCFDGNEKPALMDVLTALVGEEFRYDEEGYVWIYTYEDLYDDEGYVELSDIIAPTGAYLAPAEEYGSHRNVYTQLKAAWEAGEIDNEEVFAILFGYAPDRNGDLYSVVAEYDTFIYNGYRVKDVLDLINEDGTVMDTGLSVRDYVISVAVANEGYMDTNEYLDTGSMLIMGYLSDVLMEYMMAVLPEDGIIGEEGDYDPFGGYDTYEEFITAEVDVLIEEYSAFGDEEFVNSILLMDFAGYGTDLWGYVANGYTQKYLRDAEGNKMKLTDVMDADGKLLYPEMGESVQALMEELLANISYDALLLGDVNTDGKINLTDASVMMKQIAGWEGVEIDAVAADANGDGKSSLSDVSLTMQYIAGWDVYFAY